MSPCALLVVFNPHGCQVPVNTNYVILVVILIFGCKYISRATSFVVDACLSSTSSSPLCRRNQKLSSSQKTGEAVSNTAQAKTLPSVKVAALVSDTTDVPAVAASPDVSEYLNCESGRTDLGASDSVRKNSGLESVEAAADGSGVLTSGVNQQPQPPTVATSGADASAADANAPEGGSVNRVEQLRKMIDRAAGQLYTIAEVYLMMMKPARVPLEYDWVDTSTSGATTDDMSGRLQKLVSIAKAAFTASTAKTVVRLNGLTPVMVIGTFMINRLFPSVL